MNFKNIWLLLGTIIKNRYKFNIECKLKKQLIRETKYQADENNKTREERRDIEAYFNERSKYKIGSKHDFQNYTKQPYQGVMVEFGHMGSKMYMLGGDRKVLSPGYHTIDLANGTAKTGSEKSKFNYHLTSLN